MEQPLSVAVRTHNNKDMCEEIIFISDRMVRYERCDTIIVYNVILDKYLTLNDFQNCKSFGAMAQSRCIFKHNNNNDNGLIEYISFGHNHISLYNHNQHKMYKLKFINNNNSDKYRFPMSSALCVPFSLNNINCMLDIYNYIQYYICQFFVCFVLCCCNCNCNLHEI